MFALLRGCATQAMAYSRHDTGRHRGLERLRQSLQAIHDRKQHLLHATYFEIVPDAQPKLRTLVLAEPDTQDRVRTRLLDTNGSRHRPRGHRTGFSNLDVDRIQVPDRIGARERPMLPFGVLLHHHIGDPSNEIRRDRDAIPFSNHLA